MPRARAFLATLLALTWCSAVWHVDLEALGLLSHHHHHTHEAHHPHHLPGMIDDHHEPVVARDVSKDAHIRVVVTAALWVAFIGIAALLGQHLWRVSLEREPVPLGVHSDPPPLRNSWQFVWRCAPESAAPPALS